mmetsp:Transcript_47499/g.91856  ORF Transcript_47499/g.91856 Transcript_47499/m.91856 type:complete len:116 (-) Transcript_47499:282-629(-)
MRVVRHVYAVPFPIVIVDKPLQYPSKQPVAVAILKKGEVRSIMKNYEAPYQAEAKKEYCCPMASGQVHRGKARYPQKDGHSKTGSCLTVVCTVLGKQPLQFAPVLNRICDCYTSL